MPDKRPLQSYWATSSTVVYWVLVGVIVFFVRPFIPPLVNPKVASSDSGYVRQAAGQQVDWKEMSPDIFELARATGKPILLAIGTEWSDVSRELDNLIFASGDVAERLNRDFISVRLDAQMYRAWSSAFLQLSRAQEGWESHNQLLILSGSGQIVRVLDISNVAAALDDVRFISILEDVRFPKQSPELEQGEKEQKREVSTLVGGSDQAVPDPDAYRQILLEQLSSGHPGIKAGPNMVLPARDYVFLVGAGEGAVVQGQVHGLLARPAYSWLDNLFFRSARDADWRRVSLSVSAARNADMLEVMGSLVQSQPDSADGKIADLLFDSLLERFVAGGKYFAASYTKLGPDKRSARYSVPYSRARRIFGPDAGRATQLLGLDQINNPLMVPAIGTWPTAEDGLSRFQALIGRLQEDEKGEPAVMAGESSLDVGSRVVTALMRYAATKGDEALLSKAFDASVDLQSAQVGFSDVRHSFDSSEGSVYLGDYTNFAELELTRYRLFGDLASLETGRRVLDGAWNRFSASKPGVVLNATFPDYGLMAKDWALPKLVDDDLPSTCAQMSYLLRAYASVESDPAVRQKMRDRSDQILRTMAPAAAKISRQLGTFNLAGLLAESDTAIFSVGPDCVQQARGWNWLGSLAWSYPALATIRPDIQSRGPGFYVESRGKVDGPLTSVQVQDALSRRRASIAVP